jgi:beta-N-acetylhexosaminidase
VIETDPAEAVQRVGRANLPSRRRARSYRLWMSSLITLSVMTLVLIAVAASILAPLNPAPNSFFASSTPGPLATQRAANPHAIALPAELRERAEVAYINGLIAHMSLEEKIGQMVMIGFPETEMDGALAYEIQQFHVGSAIIYAFNIKSGPQLKTLITDMQTKSSIPLLVATDQEGGSVNRMLTIEGPLSSAYQMGATNNPTYVEQRGAQDASTLASVGINLNFAPVVDVLNASSGDIGDRAFGNTSQQVTRMAGAYLAGLQSSGHVAGAIKHFPGLGDVPVDPHAILYTLGRSETDLDTIDWAPYRSLIAQGNVYAVMSTHVILSAVDPTRPASLSEPVLTGVLRDKLGFNGVIITDGIYMRALAGYSLDQIAVYAVEAGNDIICSTYSIQSTAQVIVAITAAVQRGDISLSHLDASVRRILLLKLRLGLLPAPQFGAPSH